MKPAILSVEKTRALDARATEEFGIPSLILMENAGRSLADHIRQFMIPPIDKCRVVMVCGTGNNGGDAFVAARHLLQKGIAPHIFLVGETADLKNDAAVNYRIIGKLGIACDSFSLFKNKQKEWNGLPVLIIDALLGTGFKTPLREPATEAIREVNRFKKIHNVVVKVLAVDIPSGLHGDQGWVGPDIVRADMTVTFACLKTGLTSPEARPFVGRVEVVDIGIPNKLLQEEKV